MIQKVCVAVILFSLITWSVEYDAHAEIMISNETPDSIKVVLHPSGLCDDKTISLGAHQQISAKYSNLVCQVSPIEEVTIYGPKGNVKVTSQGVSGLGILGDFNIHVLPEGSYTCRGGTTITLPYKLSGLASYRYTYNGC